MLASVSLAIPSIQAGVAATQVTTTTVTLNGLQIILDNGTGAIRQLSYPGPGSLLDADPAEAGLVDVAYPIEKFEPLRLAARHSKGAVIEKGTDRVVIRIGKLGPSRANFELKGEVAATVMLRADPDKRSVVLSCEMYRDCQAFVNAFPAPRANVNINRSVAEARFAFMDNLFLNVWPSKPDSINGSERIDHVPELSKSLKVCAGLRKQFLPYFTEGRLVGNCLLTEPSPGVRLCGRLPIRRLRYKAYCGIFNVSPSFTADRCA